MRFHIFAVLCLLSLTKAFSYNQYVGVYDLDVKIGDQRFTDILSIYRIYYGRLGELNVSGQFEVPAAFKSVFTGVIASGKLAGNFIARENGDEFKVELNTTIDDPCNLKGTLKTSEAIFAHFSGKKRGCDE